MIGARILADSISPPSVTTGPLAIDLDGRTVMVNGEDVVLSRREWEVLAYLASRLDKFCDVDELFWRVFAPTMWVGRHRVDGMDRLVWTTVGRLRVRLGVAAPLIENRVGFGYRLKAGAPV
jgi:DNA-binding response OmpR family regulator